MTASTELNVCHHTVAEVLDIIDAAIEGGKCRLSKSVVKQVISKVLESIFIHEGGYYDIDFCGGRATKREWQDFLDVIGKNARSD